MMDERHTYRRVTDIGGVRIEDLLAQENDAGKRVLLLLLSNLNGSLIENTQATDLIRRDLNDHLKSYASHMDTITEYVNRGKGAWKPIAWILGVVQAASLSLAITVYTEFREAGIARAALHDVDVQVLSKIAQIDAQLARIKEK